MSAKEILALSKDANNIDFFYCFLLAILFILLLTFFFSVFVDSFINDNGIYVSGFFLVILFIFNFLGPFFMNYAFNYEKGSISFVNKIILPYINHLPTQSKTLASLEVINKLKDGRYIVIAETNKGNFKTKDIFVARIYEKQKTNKITYKNVKFDLFSQSIADNYLKGYYEAKIYLKDTIPNPLNTSLEKDIYVPPILKIKEPSFFDHLRFLRFYLFCFSFLFLYFIGYLKYRKILMDQHDITTPLLPFIGKWKRIQPNTELPEVLDSLSIEEMEDMIEDVIENVPIIEEKSENIQVANLRKIRS
jgi:hypothetical protein